MKLSDITIGMKVSDSWWPWKYGVVVAVLKTRVKIRMGNNIETYDSSHVQYLELY